MPEVAVGLLSKMTSFDIRDGGGHQLENMKSQPIGHGFRYPKTVVGDRTDIALLDNYLLLTPPLRLHQSWSCSVTQQKQKQKYFW